MQRHWRQVFYGMAMTGGSLIFCLLVIEATGRVFGLLPPPSKQYQFSPTKGYELVPGQGDINSYGLRDQLHPLIKPRGTFRILAIGDSYTFGVGVTQAETYVGRLEAVLNERLGGRDIRFETLNAGVPGYNTYQELIHLQEVGLQVNPDLILLGFTLSDAELPIFRLNHPKWAVQPKEWLKSHFALYSFLRLRVKRLIDRFKFAGLREDKGGGIGGSAVVPLRLAARGKAAAGWDLCRQSLKGIAAIANDRNIPVLLVIFPLLINLDGTYPFKGEHALIARTGRENQMVVLDLLPEFMGFEPSALWVKPTISHPNAHGHFIAAEAIYKAMLLLELVPLTISSD